MQLIHILSSSILLWVDENLDIDGMMRVRLNMRARPHVTRIHNLVSTANGKPRFVDDCFETDGLGCARILWWLLDEHAGSSGKTIYSRFCELFTDNPDDALKAALRIYLGTDASAPGESGYFCNQQWRNHPREMGAIQLLGQMWRSGLIPPDL